jgi:hypothetical protein
MRLFGLSLAVMLAAFAVTGCTSKSSSSSSDQSSATATAAATDSGASSSGSSSSDAAGTQIPKYPGADTNASGSTTNGMNGGSATGTVMSTSDSFDKVYTWYQGHMPAGSEKSHTTSPIESAVFILGEAGSDQTSVTITTSGGKTMITIAHAKM